MTAEHVNTSHSLVFGTERCLVTSAGRNAGRVVVVVGRGRGSGTWRRHWEHIESTGPSKKEKKKEKKWRLEPQEGKSPAPFSSRDYVET